MSNSPGTIFATVSSTLATNHKNVLVKACNVSYGLERRRFGSKAQRRSTFYEVDCQRDCFAIFITKLLPEIYRSSRRGHSNPCTIRAKSRRYPVRIGARDNERTISSITLTNKSLRKVNNLIPTAATTTPSPRTLGRIELPSL